jgi:hypothetical protein
MKKILISLTAVFLILSASSCSPRYKMNRLRNYRIEYQKQVADEMHRVRTRVNRLEKELSKARSELEFLQLELKDK